MIAPQVAKIIVVIVRDRVIPAIVSGMADIASATMRLVGFTRLAKMEPSPCLPAYLLVVIVSTIALLLSECAMTRAVIAVLFGIDASAAIFVPMTISSASVPKVPMRLSFMISKARCRSCAPPMPSNVSANPSSWNAPVMSNPTPVEMRAAANGGSANDVIQ